MRNIEKLNAIKPVLRDNRIVLEHTTELGGVINKIERWPAIHRALSLLVGYTAEDGQLVDGLIPNNQNMEFARELITRFPPSTDQFPRELFGNLQGQIDTACPNIDVVVHVLEQLSYSESREAPVATVIAEFPGNPLLSGFEETVRDVGRIVDILKIENDVTFVWTDAGSVIFGLDLRELAALVFDAALVGAKQFRDIVSGFTPENIQTFFQLFNRASQDMGGEPLDESITSPSVIEDAVHRYAGMQVNVNVPDEITPEQQNGLSRAIPQIAAIAQRGWNLSTSIQNTGSHQTINLTVVLADTAHVALPPAPEATTGDGSNEDSGATS